MKDTKNNSDNAENEVTNTQITTDEPKKASKGERVMTVILILIITASLIGYILSYLDSGMTFMEWIKYTLPKVVIFV